MRVGVFGGTFDPPHVGHLILAEEARCQLHLDRLLWVLTPDPPHKYGRIIRPWQTRLELVEAAIMDNPVFELSRVDLDRPAPYYAAITLELLAKAIPGAELFYIMGGDSLRDLPIWYEPQHLLAQVAGLGVLRRPRDRVDLAALEAYLPGITPKIQFVQAPLLDISSSDIRMRIASGRSFRYYLPSAVYELIQRHGLYQKNPA